MTGQGQSGIRAEREGVPLPKLVTTHRGRECSPQCVGWGEEGIGGSKIYFKKGNRKSNSNILLISDWMCAFCYHFSETKDELTEHMKNVHESKARFHVCKTCEKRFTARFLLLRHEEVHRYEPKLPHSRYF